MVDKGLKADDLIRRYGIALRWDECAWVISFQFAGPDIVSCGPSPEEAMGRFMDVIRLETGEIFATFRSADDETFVTFEPADGTA